MGQLFYGHDPQPIQIPDPLLTHLKAVIAAKLRRNESFTMSWRHSLDSPSGRSMIWLQPAIALRFVFESETPENLDRRLLHDLARQADSNGGLVLDLAESAELPESESHAGRLEPAALGSAGRAGAPAEAASLRSAPPARERRRVPALSTGA